MRIPSAARRWAIAVTVYLLAVFHRTSLGVAGLQASSRFHIGPSELSTFVLLQLGVYAVMQIPTGLLVDRYGPRRLLVVASVLMGGAQLLFAFAANYPSALLARALLGCGDALTFVSVLRFAASQFDPRRFPVVVAMTATAGTLGNVVATAPLTSMLRSWGWSPTFAAAGGASLLSGLAVYLFLPKRTPRASATEANLRGVRSDAGAILTDAGARTSESLRAVRARVLQAWSIPGTKAGFWLHFSTMSTGLMIGVLWGVPFMVDGQGMSRTEAGAVLLAGVVFGVAMNLVIGYFITRFPATRVPVGIAVALITVSSWLCVLAIYQGQVPRPLLIGLIVFTGVGAPASAIGFSMARDYNVADMVGTATGVVNVGGFAATTAQCLIVGWVLDLMGSTDRAAYRVAFVVAMSVQLVGIVQLVHWWLRTRSTALHKLERGQAIPVPIVRHRWDLS